MFLALRFPRWSGNADLFQVTFIVEPFARRDDDDVGSFDREFFVFDEPDAAAFDDVEDESAGFVQEFLRMTGIGFLVNYCGFGAFVFTVVYPHFYAVLFCVEGGVLFVDHLLYFLLTDT